MTPVTTLGLIGSALFGTLCSVIAKKKNRNQFGWFALGFLFGVFGLIFLYFMPRKATTEELIMAARPAPLFNGDLREKMWYYLSGDTREQKGPMSYNALEEAYHEKKIDPTTYVWHDELEDWTTISKLR